MNADFLKKEERVSLELKSLYKSYGYGEYKLSSFEEYSLYAENVSFLPEKDVIAFHAGGKMLALRPDVTLSVIKNVTPVGTRKLFYDESVYRKSASGGFSELKQIGVEIIGKVDGVARAEICELMLGTLNAVGGNYILEVSHIGIPEKLLDETGLREEKRTFAKNCLTSKNTHDFRRFAERAGVPEEAASAFEELIALPSEPNAALAALGKIGKTVDISAEIAELEELVALSGGKAEIDFSIGGDADYYNGLIFKGYLEGVPRAVLSGGRYDNLLKKFGKDAEAIGFALYLGELGKTFREKPDAPDAAVLYGDGSERAALAEAANLRRSGKRTLVCRELPADFTGEIHVAKEDV